MHEIRDSELIDGSFMNTQPDQTLGSNYLVRQSMVESNLMDLSKSNVTSIHRVQQPSTDLQAILENENSNAVV